MPSPIPKYPPRIEILDRVPIVGGIINGILGFPWEVWRTVNTVIDFLEIDCHPSWTVYLRTALPPAKDAGLTLMSFGMDDVVRGMIRPYGLRSGRKAKRGRPTSPRAPARIPKPKRGAKPPKKPPRLSVAQRIGTEILDEGIIGYIRRMITRPRPEIPEIGELIGKSIPGTRILRARKASELEKAVWTVDGFFQRLALYWMYADIINDFLYNWILGIVKSEYCRSKKWGHVDVYEDVTYTTVTPFWQVIALPHGDWGGGDIRWRGTYLEVRKDFVLCVAGLSWEPYIRLSPISIEAALMRINEEDWPVDEDKATAPPQGQVPDLIVGAELRGPAKYALMIRGTGSHVIKITDAFLKAAG